MLSRAGDVKIIDYGLAWIKGEGKDRIQGTPEYMAPEQGRKKLVNEKHRHLQLRRDHVSHGDVAPAAERRPARRRRCRSTPRRSAACSSR